MAIIDTLKSADLFESLETRYLEKIAPICIGRNYREGDMIFKEGDKATELYILTDGRLLTLEMEIHPVPDQLHGAGYFSIYGNP